MAKHKEEKTNVMRLLEQNGIPYTAHSYPADGPVDGVSVAKALGQDAEQVFKTLVCKGTSGAHYVFDIPAAESLDLRKAAKAVGEKSVAMIPQRELLPLTVFHETVVLFESICVSAGKVGYQVEVDPAKLMDFLGASAADLTVED